MLHGSISAKVLICVSFERPSTIRRYREQKLENHMREKEIIENITNTFYHLARIVSLVSQSDVHIIAAIHLLAYNRNVTFQYAKVMLCVRQKLLI